MLSAGSEQKKHGHWAIFIYCIYINANVCANLGELEKHLTNQNPIHSSNICMNVCSDMCMIIQVG